MAAPVVGKVTRHAGIAGQFSVTAEVTYGDDPTSTITFVGSAYGGPVVMITPGGSQVFVTDPDRHGVFCADWVRKFFAERS